MTYSINNISIVGNEWNEDFVEGAGAPSSHVPGGWYGPDPREIDKKIAAMVTQSQPHYTVELRANGSGGGQETVRKQAELVEELREVMFL